MLTQVLILAISYFKKKFFGPGETLSSSYQTLNTAIVHLFMENWSEIKDQRYSREEHSLSAGSLHNMKHKDPHLHLLEKDGWDTPVVSITGLLKNK